MSKAHILIARQEDIPPQILEEFTATLSRLEVPFETEQTERRIFNAIEHYIPTALVIFIAKPFFDAFLKKAGEDVYAIFKRGLAALATKAALIKARIVSSGPRKISATSEFSRVFSVYSQTSAGMRIKFLIPAEATEEEYVQIFDSMLVLLSFNYADSPDDALSTILAGSNARSLKVLHYDVASASWQVLDPSYKSDAPKD